MGLAFCWNNAVLSVITGSLYKKNCWRSSFLLQTRGRHHNYPPWLAQSHVSTVNNRTQQYSPLASPNASLTIMSDKATVFKTLSEQYGAHSPVGRKLDCFCMSNRRQTRTNNGDKHHTEKLGKHY